jgi:hypothetical protein
MDTVVVTHDDQFTPKATSQSDPLLLLISPSFNTIGHNSCTKNGTNLDPAVLYQGTKLILSSNTQNYITSTTKTNPYQQLGKNGNVHADYGANPMADYTNC